MEARDALNLSGNKPTGKVLSGQLQAARIDAMGQAGAGLTGDRDPGRFQSSLSRGHGRKGHHGIIGPVNQEHRRPADHFRGE